MKSAKVASAAPSVSVTIKGPSILEVILYCGKNKNGRFAHL